MKGDYNYCYIAISLVAIWLLLNFISNKGWFKKGKEDIVSNSKVFQPSIKFLLYFALFFLVFSFFAPFVFTRDSKQMPIPIAFDASSGVIGDTIGGLMNPFIAIAGVIVTGLAFYIQYQANKQVQDQFKLQQFESQFYEMLKLHKENVNEMAIEGYDYKLKKTDEECKAIYDRVKEAKKCDSPYLEDDNIKDKKELTGRKIFYLMLKEFHSTYEIVKSIIDKYPHLKEHSKKDLSNKYLKLSYNVFFSGKEIFRTQILEEELKYSFVKKEETELYEMILKELEVLRTCHKGGVRYLPNYDDKKALHIDFSYKPFSGHLIRLGHFYRHMYAITNFVVNENNELLTYEDKRKYLKMFRAQLSNHEVALLYYNWLAGHGDAWEEAQEETDTSKKLNKFFTDFRMIHNLSKYLVLEDFNPEIRFNNSEYRKFLYKPGKRETDGLFELFDVKSSLSEEENRKMINKAYKY